MGSFAEEIIDLVNVQCQSETDPDDGIAVRNGNTGRRILPVLLSQPAGNHSAFVLRCCMSKGGQLLHKMVTGCFRTHAVTVRERGKCSGELPLKRLEVTAVLLHEILKTFTGRDGSVIIYYVFVVSCNIVFVRHKRIGASMQRTKIAGTAVRDPVSSGMF